MTTTSEKPPTRLGGVVTNNQMLESALRCLDRALEAMNRAIEITTNEGPAVAVEHIADFLNNTDGIDETVAAATPEDWLTRWQVTPAADRKASESA